MWADRQTDGGMVQTGRQTDGQTDGGMVQIGRQIVREIDS